MARGKSNGGDGKGASGSAYLIKVDEVAKTAKIERLVVGQPNEDGETLVLKREHAVDVLVDVAVPGRGGFITAYVAQNIRGQLKDAPEFETFTVNLDIDKMEAKKPGKAKTDTSEDTQSAY